MARRKDHFGRSLAISLVIHMALLSLQFGAPGLGLPWPGLAMEERKASIPALRATLRPQPAPVAVAGAVPARPPVAAVEPRLPPRKKLRPRAKHVVPKEPTGKSVVARQTAKVPAVVAAPAKATVVPQVSSVMTARVEQVPPVPPVGAIDHEIVKPVVIAEKRKPESDGLAVLSTERESDWRMHAANPVAAGAAPDRKVDVVPEPVDSEVIRQAEALERQQAEALAEERRREEVALAAKLAEEQARARKVAEAVQERERAERAERVQRAAAHARAAAEALRKEEEVVAERLRMAREKARQERKALASEREEELKAEQAEWTAALARAEEARKKEEQAAQLKARDEAAREAREAREAIEKKRQETLAAETKKREVDAARIAEAAQAKAREEAREEARIRAAQAETEARLREQIAAANAAAGAATERIRMTERAVGKGGAGATDGSGKPAAMAPAKGVDLARQALDMARNNLSGLPLRAPVETAERSRRGSILGRNPSDVQLAFYGESWVQKIERISSVNYPKLSRHLHYGSLVLSVTINSDGSLAGRHIAKSSGNRELDEAVLRIVDMCAPFAAFPPDLKRNYDSVEVTRTLTFPEKPPVVVSQ